MSGVVNSSAGRAGPWRHGDEPRLLHALSKVSLDVRKMDIAHGPFERVPEHVTFIDDGLTFDVTVHAVGHGRRSGDDDLGTVDVLRVAGNVSLGVAPPMGVGHLGDVGGLHDLRGLVAKRGCEGLMASLHFVVGEVEFGLARLVGRDLRRVRTVQLRLVQMVLDLLPALARGLEVLRRVPADLGLPALASLDVVAELLQTQGQFRSVDRRGVLLGLIEFPGLERARVALGRLRDVEDHHMRVQLRRGIAIHRPRAVMLEAGRDPLAGGFGRMVAADSGLDVVLQLLKGDRHTRAVRLTDALVPADQGRQRDALGRGEGRVPAGAMLHGLHRMAVRVVVGVSRPMAHERLVGVRVMTLSESLKVRLIHGTRQLPLGGELAVPLPVNLGAFRVVVLAGVAKLLGVIPSGLSGTEGFGDAEHGGAYSMLRGSWPRSSDRGTKWSETLVFGAVSAGGGSAGRGAGKGRGKKSGSLWIGFS